MSLPRRLFPFLIYLLSLPASANNDPAHEASADTAAPASIIFRAGAVDWQTQHADSLAALFLALEQESQVKLLLACHLPGNANTALALAECDTERQKVRQWLLQQRIASHRILQQIDAASELARAESGNLIEIRLAP